MKRLFCLVLAAGALGLEPGALAQTAGGGVSSGPGGGGGGRGPTVLTNTSFALATPFTNTFGIPITVENLKASIWFSAVSGHYAELQITNYTTATLINEYTLSNQAPVTGTSGRVDIAISPFTVTNGQSFGFIAFTNGVDVLVLSQAQLVSAAIGAQGAQGPAGQNGTLTGSYATYAGTAGGLINWSEPTFYLSPVFGSDTNNGTTRASPFKTYIQAANFAYSNRPANIIAMAGTNYFIESLSGGYNIQMLVPPQVNLHGEQGNWFVMVRTNQGTTLSYSEFQPNGSNIIEGINFLFVSPSSTDTPLGVFAGSGSFGPLTYAVSTFPVSMLNVQFIRDYFYFQGTGIHFENSADATLYSWTFDACRFWCNNNFLQMRSAGPLVTVENSEVWLQNWTNNLVINTKPLRLFESRTLPNVFSNNFPARIINTIIHVSDADLSASNRYFTLLYNTGGSGTPFVFTNIFLMKDCLVDEVLTNPASVDIQTQSTNLTGQCVLTIQNSSRLDTGGFFTTASGVSASILNATYSGTFTGNGSRLNYPSNTWSLNVATNGLGPGDFRFANSNGFPVVVAGTNGAPYYIINYLSPPGGGVIP